MSEEPPRKRTRHEENQSGADDKPLPIVAMHSTCFGQRVEVGVQTTVVRLHEPSQYR